MMVRRVEPGREISSGRVGSLVGRPASSSLNVGLAEIESNITFANAESSQSRERGNFQELIDGLTEFDRIRTCDS